jgi:hypothetical protein
VFFCTCLFFVVVLPACNCSLWVRVRVTFRLIVSQSIRLGVKPILGLLTRNLSLSGVFIENWGSVSFGVEIRWGELYFSIYLILSAALGPGVQPLTEMSTGNIKKKSFWGVKCGWCVGLTTLPPSTSRLSRQCGILNISQPNRTPRPVTEIALLLQAYFCSVYILCGVQTRVCEVFVRADMV